MGARKLSQTRIDGVRGNRDEMTSQATFERNLAVLSGVGLRYRLHDFDGGHQMDGELLQRLAADRS
jgi:hypothetical protein